MTLGQGIELGSFSFPVIRMLLAVGLVRVIIRGERLVGRMNSLDWLMLVWATWALISSIFHEVPSAALIFRLGLVYNSCGIYFLLRIYCQSFDDVVRLCRITAILLIPMAVEMIYEKMTVHNFFSVLGGVPESSPIREGKIRAQGAFAHSILAGTVGAVSLPLMIGLWQRYKKTAVAGILACFLIIFASASSGPIMTSIAAIGALFMWRYRHKMRIIRWVAVVGYIVLDIAMTAPAYYLISRIDLVGGSTGWHRSFLIETAFNHLQEWWLAGTDYTRHWMPTGVPWSAEHADITNHYLKMGVIGGLPLMLLFIATLFKGFSFVGQTLQRAVNLPKESQFIVWVLGAALFSHAVTFIAVSYFDQSYVFIYLTLAAIGSARSGALT
ncbi:MAG: hypothetical protein A2Y53_04375 [Chloroflexi bacterium RBG_16_47_49]|nr:MAG: hypothetical protein A2Y53_04375 [Chloroflexi bacterium RBG_16_47_49]